LAERGCRKYHRILEVNPLALFEVSRITGGAVYGCVNPRNENDVRSILKLAFPVTAQQNGK